MRCLRKVLSISLIVCIFLASSWREGYVRAADLSETEDFNKKKIKKLYEPENTNITINEKQNLNEVKKLFPSSLEAQFEGEAERKNIIVEWKCEEDYLHTQYSQYIFKPLIDDTQYMFSDSYNELEIPMIEVTIDETSAENQESDIGENIYEDELNVLSEVNMEGSGTAESPYLITTPEQLDAVRNDLSGHYQLQNDIDLWQYNTNGWKPIGDGKNPFTGVFDGNGYRIVGFEKLEGTGDTVLDTVIDPRGFFSCMSDGTIMNLGLITENEKVFNGTAKSTTSGLLLGRGSGKIINCYAIGDLESTKGTAVGLLAGEFSGSIERCWSKGSIKAKDPWWGSKGTVSAGGIVGKADGTIKDCYSICDIMVQVESIVTQQTSYAGGIVGARLNEKVIAQNCYFSGELYTGDTILNRVGGIIACFEYDRPDMSKFEISNCYFNSDTTKITSEIDSNMVSKLGIPKTTNEMRDRSIYEGWDFENIWQLGEYVNDGYPYFRNIEKVYINGGKIEISYTELFTDYPEYLYNVVTKRIFNQAWEASAEAIGIYSDGDKDKWLAGQYILYEGLFHTVVDAGMQWVVKSISKYFDSNGLYYENYEDKIIDQIVVDIVTEFVEDEDFVEKAWLEAGKSFSTMKKLCDYGGKISKEELKSYIIEFKKWDMESAEKMIEQVSDKLDESLGEIDVVLDDADTAMRVLQVITKVMWTSALSEQAIVEVKDKIPENTELYMGLNRLENRIKDPVGEMMQYIIDDAAHECATMIANGAEDIVLSLILTPAGKKIVDIGKDLIRKTIEVSVYAKADDYVRAIAYKGASMNIQGIFVEIQRKYAQNKKDGIHIESSQLAKDIVDYQKYFNLYMTALDKELGLMKDISKSDRSVVRHIEVAQELIKDYDSEVHLKNSLRQAEQGWRLKYTKRDGIISIAGDAKGDISTYSMDSLVDIEEDSIMYIPGELEGNPVKSILPYAFAENPTIKIIIIGEGVEEIGEGAFANCPNLRQVLLPKSLKMIKAGAFANCDQITDIEIPESVEIIDEKAFDYNNNLTVFAETHSKAADYARNMQYELIETESQVTNVEISKYPDKVEFCSDEEIDLSGMELLVTYMNGEKETVTDNWIILDGLLNEEPQILQIQYMDTRLSIPITLNVKEHEYCIKYVDAYGVPLAEETNGKALFGEKIIELPINIEGYTAINDMYSFIIGNKNNVFNIIYNQNEKTNLEEGGSIDQIEPQKESGNEITPNVVVKHNNQILIKDRDFMPIYIDNIEPGTATVLAVGLNEYDGIISREFLIEKAGGTSADDKNKEDESDSEHDKNKGDEPDSEYDKNKDNEVNETNMVNTGDDSNSIFWTISLFLSVMYCFTYKRYKKGNRKK